MTIPSDDPKPDAEVRTCYCGTTATVVPGVFPHRDCDGSIPARTGRDAAAPNPLHVHILVRDADGDFDCKDPACVTGYYEPEGDYPPPAPYIFDHQAQAQARARQGWDDGIAAARAKGRGEMIAALTRHEIAGLVGTRIVVHRYIQPSLSADDPEREPAGEHDGIVTGIDAGGRMILDSCPDPIWPEPQFLGGEPQRGTSRYLVTEISKENRP